MRSLGLLRVERVENSVFGDSPDKRNQLVTRCVTDAGVVFFVAAGDHSDEKITNQWVIRLRDTYENQLQLR